MKKKFWTAKEQAVYRAQGDQGPDPAAAPSLPRVFRVFFSQFEPVYARTGNTGRMYSFTLTWEIAVGTKLLGMSLTRCQFQVLKSGVKGPLYRWAPAQNVKGFAHFHNNIPYPDLYTYVLDELMKTPYAARLGRPKEEDL